MLGAPILKGGFLLLGLLLLIGVAGAAGEISADAAPPRAGGDAPFPLDERLRYKVSWMGLHCGQMTLESFASPGEQDTTYHIVMTAASSSFFDGIYRVRARIESWFSGRLGSSIRYHYVSDEKKRHRDDLYEVDFEAGAVRRTKDGKQQLIPLEADRVHDPLAYLYRLRLMLDDEGDEASLTLVTSEGALETVAEVVERKRISTPFGRRDALRVVPHPRGEMLFAKKGRMAVWVGMDERRRPYRVIFDLAFGKLVAKLVEVEEITDPEAAPHP
jgi:hypothetical protein